MPQLLIEKIQKYCTKKPILAAYLFGSYAKNQADENSDIDILVELDYSQMIGLSFIDMQAELNQLLGKKVDLVSAQGLSKYIQPLIDAEKIKIYEKK
jgi:predicted nucleotidyltransferase